MNSSSMDGTTAVIMIIYFAWYVFYIVQLFLSYGTAYRKTKANGDNGVSLFGWMFLYALASMIPGLGIYFWKKSKSISVPAHQSPQPQYAQPQAYQQQLYQQGQQPYQQGQQVYQQGQQPYQQQPQNPQSPYGGQQY